MGNEFGHPEWIDFPRAENGWSFDHARRQWSLRDDPALRFKALGDFDAAMTRLVGPHRRREPVPLVRNDVDHVLAFWRDGLIFVFNFDPVRSFTDYGIQVPPGLRRAQLVLDTDETRFGGQGRIAPDQTFFPADTCPGDELIRQIQLYLPARSAIVLRTRLN
jgi:1,4-alpha-glucan branching enzyme